MGRSIRTSAACIQCSAGRIPATVTRAAESSSSWGAEARGEPGVGGAAEAETSLGDEAVRATSFDGKAAAVPSLGEEGPDPSLATGDLSPIVAMIKVA